MERLLTIYREAGLDVTHISFQRKAFRAIVVVADKLLLIRSRRFGECKFPGGAAEPGEKAFDTLARETHEETGYRLKTKIRPFGSVIEIGRDRDADGVFVHESRYYFCSVHSQSDQPFLQDYEIEYGYEPVWMSAAAALAINESIQDNPAIPWKKRETEVLRILILRGVSR
ncbi:MAG: NUDIX domain-containing protein [bacterium]